MNPSPRLLDLVDRAAETSFQGRERELALFRTLLAEPERLPRIVDVYGPPGIGKSTLLQAFRRLAEREGLARMVIIDSSEFRHTVESLYALLRERLDGAWPPTTPTVVGIDTFEQMADMQYSFRSGVVEQLQGPVLLVIAGRRPLGELQGPSLGWSRFVDWIRLGELDQEQSAAYLKSLGLQDRGLIHKIVGFAAGHPLALSIAGQLASGSEFGVRDVSRLDASPHVIRALSERLANEVADEDVRQLVEAAALVRTFDEELLEAMLGRPAPDAFDRFSRLSIVQLRGSGLAIHDAVRPFIVGDTRWRRPRRHQELRQRAFAHLSRLAAEGTRAPFDITLELLFLAEEAVIQSAFFGQRAAAEMRPATPEDHDFLRQATAARALGIPGASPEKLLADLELFWELAPERFSIALAPDGEAIAFSNTIPLNRATVPRLRRHWAGYFDHLDAARMAELLAEPAGSAAAGLVAGMVISKDGHSDVLQALLREAILRHLRETRRLVIITPYDRFKQLAERLLFRRVGSAANLFSDELSHEAFELDLGSLGFDAWIERLLGMEAADAGDAGEPGGAAAGGSLSGREREVSRLLISGLTNQAIGLRLGISPRTVEVHVGNAMNKLGFESRTQLAAWAAVNL